MGDHPPGLVLNWTFSLSLWSLTLPQCHKLILDNTTVYVLGILFCYGFAPLVSVFASCVLFMFALIPVLPCLSLGLYLSQLHLSWSSQLICPNSSPAPSSICSALGSTAAGSFVVSSTTSSSMGSSSTDLPDTYLLDLPVISLLYSPLLQCNLSSTSSLWSLSSTITHRQDYQLLTSIFITVCFLYFIFTHNLTLFYFNKTLLLSSSPVSSAVLWQSHTIVHIHFPKVFNVYYPCTAIIKCITNEPVFFIS